MKRSPNSPASIAKARLKAHMGIKAMTMDDLAAWVAGHAHAMTPAPDDASEGFVVIVRAHYGGQIPAFLTRFIDPATIHSGDVDGRVYVRFTYRAGLTVTVYPDSEHPSEKDWAEMGAHFSRCECDSTISHSASDGIATTPGGLSFA